MIEVSKHFFFEKKKQKTFASRSVTIRVDAPKKIKSLLLLFFRKEVLASFLESTRHAS